MPDEPRPAAARPVRLKTPLLGVVCRKCVKRVGGKAGKAGKQLTRALRYRLDAKVQAADVGCLKLCPKNKVVVVPMNGSAQLVPGEDWANDAADVLAASWVSTGQP